jgi:hypothetical protein
MTDAQIHSKAHAHYKDKKRDFSLISSLNQSTESIDLYVLKIFCSLSLSLEPNNLHFSRLRNKKREKRGKKIN